jgi:hypothetical protein
MAGSLGGTDAVTGSVGDACGRAGGVAVAGGGRSTTGVLGELQDASASASANASPNALRAAARGTASTPKPPPTAGG